MSIEHLVEEFNQWIGRVFQFDRESFAMSAVIMRGNLNQGRYWEKKRVLVGYGHGGIEAFSGFYLRAKDAPALLREMKEYALMQWAQYGYNAAVHRGAFSDEDVLLFENHIAQYRDRLRLLQGMVAAYQDEAQQLRIKLQRFQERMVAAQADAAWPGNL